MTRTALLNNVEHKDLRVIARHGAAFGDNINQVAVVPTEFEAVQREYPILLTRVPDGGGYQAVALLGLDRDENLFLDAQGWQARYVPAIQLRGPFLIGFQQQGAGRETRRDSVIHVQLDHPRISRVEGEPLFLPQGGNSPYLDHIVRVMRLMHQGIEVSGAMYAAFTELDLIEPLKLQINLSDREQYALEDYYTIGEERLARLRGAGLERLHASGYLRAAYGLIASLQNVSRLIELKNRRRATA